MSTGTYASRTQVSSDKSRAEIERTLKRYGATQFAYGWKPTVVVIEFAMGGRHIRFTIPMPDPADKAFTRTPTGKPRTGTAAEQEYEQAVRQRWRALLLVLKAKLEAVQAGIVTLEQEFFAHTVLPDGRTIHEWLAPQLAQVYARGQMPALLPGSAQDDDRST